MLNKVVNYVTIGYTLLAFYLVQEVFDLRWGFLEELQLGESYKRWSGFVVGGFMILQWSLTFVKVVKRWSEHAFLFTLIHKWMGALSPIVFYAHAMEFGFAYLFFLSISFYLNVLLGLINTDEIKLKADWYFQGWMILHVSISTLLTALMFYHGFIAYYYK